MMQPYLQEFLNSAIALDVAQENTYYLEGRKAGAEFLQSTIAARQKVRSYITSGNAALCDYYDFMEAGAWFARPAVEVAPYAKPNTPRPNPKKLGKSVKYETPPGAEAEPLFPHLGAAVNASWGVSTWAEVLVRPDIPIVLTEGWKKALALISQGIPAIALRSVTQWHAKHQREVWPSLAPYIAGRIVLVAYDQDGHDRTDKTAKVVANVSKQAKLLGNAIERAEGKPRFIVWPSALGKGIDDALAALPAEDRGLWLEQRLSTALTPKQYRRVEAIARSWAILSTPAPTPARHTEGEYLQELPPLTKGAVNWVAATVGSGKTYRIGRDWVRPWVAAGGVVVVVSPLNALGQQTSEEWDLPHIHDYATDANSQQALIMDIRHRGGLICCFNSLHRALSLIPQNCPLLLVKDEAAQVVTDAAEGGTLGNEWAARWEDAIAIMQRAATTGAIVLAEDGLGQDTIDLVKKLSGANQDVGYSHIKAATPQQCRLYRATPLSHYRGQLLAQLQAGEKIIYLTTSQAEGRRVEAAVSRQLPSLKLHRIDSTTNEGGRYRKFFENPDQWIEDNQPDLLVLSPSARTGLSIEGRVSVEDAYFDSVWGYFPSLDVDTHKQMLGRYRPSVPRHIWAPAYITPDPGEGPSQWCMKRSLDQEAAIYATYGGFGQAPADSQNSTIKSYLAARRQRRWAQKIQPAEVLADALTKAGHQVEVITSGIEPDEAIADLWRDVKEQIAQDDATYHAYLDIDETHTLEWANKVLRGIDSTHEQRCKAAKVRMMTRFPGLDWNQPQLWYEAQFCPRQSETGEHPSGGPMAPGAALWAEAEHYQALWEGDAKAAAQILSQRLKAAHLLPQAGPRAMLAKLFRADIEALLKAGTITPGGKVEAHIKATALKHSAELRRYWRLSVSADQTDTAIANKIARKFGLTLSRLKKVRINGSQQWSYGIKATDTWRQLVAARQAALTGTNSLKDCLNKSVPLHPPSDSGRGGEALPLVGQGMEFPLRRPGSDYAVA